MEKNISFDINWNYGGEKKSNNYHYLNVYNFIAVSNNPDCASIGEDHTYHMKPTKHISHHVASR